jgi:rfaE bifunctional protein kinase chain/domain
MIISKRKLSTKSILIVGDFILDEYMFGTVERISPEAPVPILNVVSVSHRAGGAANVAINCRELGCNVKVLGHLGNDNNGKKLEEILKKYDIKCFFHKRKEYSTIKKTRLISKSQQIMRIDEEKKTLSLSSISKNKFEDLVQDVDIVLFSDYDKGSLNCLSDLIAITKKYDKISLVDPKGIDPYKFSGADVLTPNLKEIQILLGPWNTETELEEKIFMFMKKIKIKNVVLTRSSEGMTLYELENMNVYHYSSDVSEVYDVTGAGDSVISIISVLTSIKLPLKEACFYANKGGGVAVQKFGASSLKFEEVFN